MARARKSDKPAASKSKAFSIFEAEDHHADETQEELPKDEAGRRKIKRQYEELLNRERINKTIEGIYYICASCRKVCHNVDDGLVEDPNNLNNLCSACATAKEPRGGKGGGKAAA